MFNLLKYEFRKTWYTKAILLVFVLIAQAVFLFGIFADKYRAIALSVVALVMLASFGVMAVGLVSLFIFHRDLNTKQSYMLFMTPNSSFKILGAKVFENGLSTFLAGAFFAGLGVVDMGILAAHEGDLMMLIDMFKDLIESLQSTFAINAQNLIAVFFMLLCVWLMTLTNAFLAIVLSATVLAGKKFSGLVSFIIFLLINWGLSRVLHYIPTMDTFFLDIVVNCICAIVLTVIMDFITAWIMDKKLSV